MKDGAIFHWKRDCQNYAAKNAKLVISEGLAITSKKAYLVSLVLKLRY